MAQRFPFEKTFMVSAGTTLDVLTERGRIDVVSGAPDRIIVAVWGDRNRQGAERPNGSNCLVAVNRHGDIIERWQQWDPILNKPQQVYISPYDPGRTSGSSSVAVAATCRCRSSSSPATARSS